MTHLIVINHRSQHFHLLHQFCEIQMFVPFFASFSLKSPSVTKRSVSQANAFKKGKTLRHFFAKQQALLILSFLLKQFYVFEYRSLNSRKQYTVVYGKEKTKTKQKTKQKKLTLRELRSSKHHCSVYFINRNVSYRSINA